MRRKEKKKLYAKLLETELKNGKKVLAELFDDYRLLFEQLHCVGCKVSNCKF